MKMQSEMRKELDETHVLLASKDREITQKTMLIEELKFSQMENHRIIEGMYSEVQRLQENARHGLLRCNVTLPCPLGKYDTPPHQHSLQSEIQELQELGSTEEANSPLCGLLSSTNQKDEFQKLLHQIKSQEHIQMLHTEPEQRDTIKGARNKVVERLERAYFQCQQQHSSTKQHLANVIRELELLKVLKSEAEDKVLEQEQGLAEAEKDNKEAKKMAAMNWWRALKAEEEKIRAKDETAQVTRVCVETKEKLLQAQGVIKEMESKLCHLEASLMEAQQKVPEAETRGQTSEEAVPTNHTTWEQGAVLPEKKVMEDGQKTAQNKLILADADTCEPEVINLKESALQSFLGSLKKMEETTSQVAELIRLGEQRFVVAKEKLDAVTERIEAALERAENAEIQFNLLESRVSAKNEPTDSRSPTGSVGGSPSVAFSETHNTEKFTCPAPKATTICQSSPCDVTNGEIISLSTTRQSKDKESSCTVCVNDRPSRIQHPFFSVCSGQHYISKDSSRHDTSLLDALALELLKTELQTNSCCVRQLSPNHSQGRCQNHLSDNCECKETDEDVESFKVITSSDCCQTDPKDNGDNQALVEQSTTATHTDPQPVEDEAWQPCSQALSVRPSEQPPSAPSGPAKNGRPLLRPRPSHPPTMPTLPEEEEDSPEELDSSSSSPVTFTPVLTRMVPGPVSAPSIVLPRQGAPVDQDSKPLEQTRPHSPRPRLSRSSFSSGNPITTVDSEGHVIDLIKDQLPDVELSNEDKKKNLELLEEAKKVSERFLMRRGRRSICSLSESPTGLSPNPTPRSSPVPSRSSSLTVPPQIAPDGTEVNYVNPPINQHLEVPSPREKSDTRGQEPESPRKPLDRKPHEKRKVSQGTLPARLSAYEGSSEAAVEQKENCDPRLGGETRKKPPSSAGRAESEEPGRGSGRKHLESPDPPVGKGPVAPPLPSGACTAELKSIGCGPPLMRAVSWDSVGPVSIRNGTQAFPAKNDEPLSFYDKSNIALLKATGYKDFPVQPVRMQKLVQMREEHKLMRNQSIIGSKLPDLSETAEQERGPSPNPTPGSPTEEEPRANSDVMPNISDVMLRKLKLHRALPTSAPPLTEKEVENAFVQLSLAFRNDSYTLESRLHQAERERNLTEENTEKELEDFKGFIKGSVLLWQNSEQRESYQRLLETVVVLHRLAVRLSSRAEMVGAVRQEKRMNKATEVMLQYVENLKRTYEKDHAELVEFKKLANQNSNRCYGSIDTGDDGVPRASRSMSLTLGKALPRRRVSVAVVPKFNLLNIPGQSPNSVGPGLPVLCEANSGKCSTPSDPVSAAGTEKFNLNIKAAMDDSIQTPQKNEKASRDPENETSSAPPSSNLDEIRSEIKAKIEEEAYNKGYEEGLKRSKELQELKEEEEKADESQEDAEEAEKEMTLEKKSSSRFEEALGVFNWLCPKIFRQNRLCWIIAIVVLVFAFIISVFTSFGHSYEELGEASSGNGGGSGKKLNFGWNVGLQPKNPTPE
ncbi:inositol 1,4,5-triphosphate receptor associated 1 [Lepisosteus oculatus]|uniref:inositol 1,4,5-triphosphate receptor associated 1 n=1 Tax=Lepisosteus oculatus TaxID=7918 RepID=UPI0035F51660